MPLNNHAPADTTIVEYRPLSRSMHTPTFLPWPPVAGVTRQEAPPMTLDPERYECPEHNVNVTDQVMAKLDPGRPDVAFGGPFGRKQASSPHDFQVTVTCP